MWIRELVGDAVRHEDRSAPAHADEALARLILDLPLKNVEGVIDLAVHVRRWTDVRRERRLRELEHPSGVLASDLEPGLRAGGWIAHALSRGDDPWLDSGDH